VNFEDNAKERLLCRCPTPLGPWGQIAIRRHRAIPVDRHAQFALAREICKPYKALDAGSAFANDLGHYWTGGSGSVILALSWCRHVAELSDWKATEAFTFAAVVDAGWRCKDEVGSEGWYQFVDQVYDVEVTRLYREGLV